MDIELSAVRRALRMRQNAARYVGAARVIEGAFGEHEIVLGKTGMGKKRIPALMGELFGAYEIGCIIFAGVAGAVNTELRAGDVVIPETVRTPDGRTRYDTAWRLLAGERPGALPVKIGGTQYTVDRVFGSDDKASLRGRDPKAASVDMESSYICERAGRVPCLILRGISDTHDFTFPKIFFVNRKNFWSVIKYFPAHPRDFYRFLALWRNCARAAKNTADVVAEIVRSNCLKGALSL